MSGGVELTYQLEGVDRLLRQYPDSQRVRVVVGNLLERFTLKIREEAVRRIAKRTGDTARSVSHKVDRANLVAYVGDFAVGTAKKVGLWLERGTGLFGPHHQRIFPLHAKALAWPVGRSGPGGERLDMGLHEAGSLGLGGLSGPVMSPGSTTLRRTGSHTQRYAARLKASGQSGMTVRRSIAGMHPQPWLQPGYTAALPYLNILLNQAGREMFSTAVREERA